MFERTMTLKQQLRVGLIQGQVGTVIPPFTFDFIVTPTGGTGAGTLADPWSLSYAIGSGVGSASGDGKLVAGNHVGIRAGVYDAGASNWTFAASGTSVGQIIYRNYKGENVKIINEAAGASDVVKFNCNYVSLWGVEIYDNGWTNRNIATQTNGCVDLGNTFGNGCKLIHCIIHDGEQCIENITGAVLTDHFEVYGCIIYNAGVDVSPLGHNFYSHHAGSSTAQFLVNSNVIFNSFGLLGQFYGNTDNVDWFTADHNIWFGGGALSGSNHYGSQMVLYGGGAQPPTHITYTNNMLYGDDLNGRTLEVGFGTGIINTFEVGNNYHVGGGHGAESLSFTCTVSPESSLNVHDNFWKVADANSVISTFTDVNPVSYTWTNNEWHHISTSGFAATSFATWKTNTSLGGTDTQVDAAPGVTKVFVVPTTKYEVARGHVCFFNWANSSTVAVDLSSILLSGDSYAVYDVRDLVNPVLTGTYTGGSVNFPTTQKSDPTPIGGFVTGGTPNATAPFFNAFLVKKT